MTIEYDKDPAKAVQQRQMLDTMAKMTFGQAPPEELQKLIDATQARIDQLQAVIDDPAATDQRKKLCQLSMEQETTMMEMYRAAQ